LQESLEPLEPDPLVLPNELWRQPQASPELKAKNNGPWERASSSSSSSEAHFLSELWKGVFPGYQFVCELKSLLLEL
jgi:hypothetical protein